MPTHIQSEQPNPLRQMAEEVLQDAPDTGAVDPSSLTTEDLRDLIHELRVHQVELKMQNDELKAAQHELERFNQRLVHLFDFAPVGYVVLDRGGVIQNANLKIAQLLGMERIDLIGSKLSNYVSPDKQDVYFSHMWPLFKHGEPQTCEVRLYSPQRSRFPARLEAVLHQAEGEIGRTAHVTVSDLTVERQLDDLLAKETELVEEAQATQARLAFISMVAHELRNPLTVILGFADTLLADDIVLDRAEKEEFLGYIQAEARELHHFVDLVLDTARADASLMQVTPSSTSIDTILSPLQSQLLVLLEKHTLQVKVHPHLPPLMVDARRILQVLLNLIDNARKYAPSGSEIVLEVEPDGEMARCSVRDSGPGISADARDYVFEPFRQGTDAADKPGAGLGLAISKAIVEAHGGSIWIEDGSTPGTCICFTVPFASGE